jgi:proteasome lid subunit RPN8/RPN11
MSNPTLRFTPYAYAKLLYFRDVQDTEIGGFGITDPKDPMLVVDFKTLKQEVSMASVDFDGEDLNEYMFDRLDEGLDPADSMRVWIHTHPGDSPNPSGTDEDNWKEHFSNQDWAVMFIMAKGGATYARLRVSNVVATEQKISSMVDWTANFYAVTDEVRKAWKEEFEANIEEELPSWRQNKGNGNTKDTTPGKSRRLLPQAYSLYDGYDEEYYGYDHGHAGYLPNHPNVDDDDEATRSKVYDYCLETLEESLGGMAGLDFDEPMLFIPILGPGTINEALDYATDEIMRGNDDDALSLLANTAFLNTEEPKELELK